MSNSRVLTGQIQKLDKELSNQKREIAALQRAVTDMQSALVQERKISAKVYAENDKLKIQELENRRKVSSSYCSKPTFRDLYFSK